MSAFPEYSRYDGLSLAELVLRIQVSSSELLEQAIAPIEAHNPRLNDVISKL